jgi:hypothetical protein
MNNKTIYLSNLHKGDNDLLLSERLVLDVNDKDNAYIHSACLQYYMDKGLVIKKAHKVLQFTQKPIFREFEEKVSDLRTEAKKSGDKICALMLKAI